MHRLPQVHIDLYYRQKETFIDLWPINNQLFKWSLMGFVTFTPAFQKANWIIIHACVLIVRLCKLDECKMFARVHSDFLPFKDFTCEMRSFFFCDITKGRFRELCCSERRKFHPKSPSVTDSASSFFLICIEISFGAQLFVMSQREPVPHRYLSRPGDNLPNQLGSLRQTISCSRKPPADGPYLMSLLDSRHMFALRDATVFGSRHRRRHSCHL